MKFDLKNEKSSSQIKSLIIFFFTKGDKDIHDVKFARAVKLKKMMEIYRSDFSDLEKCSEMKKLYKSSEKFRGSFYDLEKYKDDKFVGKIYRVVNKIADNFEALEKIDRKEINNLLEMDRNGYFDDYYYACEFINEYIEYEDSPFLKDFLKTAGLNIHQFGRFVNIVSCLNPDLYDLYAVKARDNKNARKAITLTKINNLYNGIKTGVNEEGNEFDDLEVFRNLPFYDNDSALEVLNDFEVSNIFQLDRKVRVLVEKVKPEATRDINMRIIQSGAFKGSIKGVDATVMSEREIHSTNYIVRGTELTDHDKDVIINYMKNNDIPLLPRCFSVVRDRYLEGTLNIDEVKTLKR